MPRGADRLTGPETSELARLFSDRESATWLLRAINWPEPRLPPWRDDAAAFWAQAARLLEAGIVRDGRHELLSSASDLYPGNPTFEHGLSGRRSAAGWITGLARRHKAVTAALATLVVLAIALALTVFPSGRGTNSALAEQHPGDGCGPGLTAHGSECIGVLKVAGAFTRTPASQQTSADRQVAALWAEVVQENTLAGDSSAPVATILVAAQLSDAAQVPQLEADQLAGALLAQREWNNPANQYPFRVRLWAVNIGGSSRYIGAGATAIRAAAADRSVIGVTGLGETRQDSHDAIALLGQPLPNGAPGVPMISATQSGDALSRLRFYFRIAPPNRDQVTVGMQWAIRSRPGVQPYIVYDQNDPYSAELAGEYRAEARKDSLERDDRVLPYQESLATAGDGPLEQRTGDVNGLMCGQSPTVGGVTLTGAPRLVLFSGRQADLYLLLRELNATNCASSITVLAGDAITGVTYPPLAQDVYDQLQARKSVLDYVAFGAESVATGRLLDASGVTAGWPGFQHDYDLLREQLGPDERIPPEPDANGQDEFDAVSWLATAGRGAVRCATNDGFDPAFCADLDGLAAAVATPNRTPPPGVLGVSGLDLGRVYAALRRTTDRERYPGLAGVVDVGPPPADPRQGLGADPQNKLLAVYEMTAGPTAGSFSVRYMCSTDTGRNDVPGTNACS